MGIHQGKMRKCVQCGKRFRTIAEVILHQRDSRREERGLHEAVYDNEAYLHLRAGRECAFIGANQRQKSPALPSEV